MSYRIHHIGSLTVVRGFTALSPLIVQFGHAPNGQVRWQFEVRTERRRPLFSERYGHSKNRVHLARIGRHHLSLWINRTEVT